jgi:hypothetical protein
MENESFQVDLPKEFLPYIQNFVGGSLEEKTRIALALGLYVGLQISIESATALSGQSMARFTELAYSMITRWKDL